MTTSTWSDLLAPPAALRTVGRGDYPYPGTVRAGVPPRVWVDAGDAALEGACAAAGDGHILSPVDIARTPSGHALLLPLCPDRLAPRIHRCLPLSAGEVVNIVVSLLRGAAEADVLGQEDGSWWITDDGRPVLALGGASGWREETGTLLRMLAADHDAALVQAIETAGALVADRQASSRRWTACEQSLLGLADPEPLAPRTLADAAPQAAVQLPRSAAAAVLAPEPPPDGTLLDRLLRAWDGEFAGRLRALMRRSRAPAATTSGARAEPTARAKRTPWIVAAAIAALIVLAGALWPDDAPSAASSTPQPATPTTAASTPSATPSASSPAAAEPEEAAAAVLDRLAHCLQEGDDCADVREDVSRPVPSGAASAPGRTVTLLDEYGGAAVLRAQAPDDAVPDQIVVIVRDGDGWLVRDIYDIAEQP